jgi:arsenate reductase-like glutaredoxin family protein
MTTGKELKKQLRALRKLKRETQVHSEARRGINKQIREVKSQLGTIDAQLAPSESKQKLIEELLEVYRRLRRPILVDFRGYSEEDLKIHLTKVKDHRYD